MAIVELSEVELTFEGGTQALTGLNLSVERGEWVAVLGANGSGKSTLASVVAGLTAPDRGRVCLAGQTVFDEGRDAPIDYEAYRCAKRKVGLVFQNPDDQIVTTVVSEDVAFGPENLGLDPEEIGRRVDTELRRVALTELAQADPTRLSGGQKQRVAIAGTLAMRPEILVFDEPGALLDVRGRRSIMRVMSRLKQSGATIIHITHFMDEALLADRVIVLEAGRIVLEGEPDSVFADDERIRALGLAEPFCVQASKALGVGWTASFEELVARLVRRRQDPEAASGEPSAPPARQVREAEPAITCEHVSYSYVRQRLALDDISLMIRRGVHTAILGQTGSGKSTLLRLICALETPDAGTLTVDGIPTKRRRDRRLLHGRVGYVMQHPERQLFARTVAEDVKFGPRNLGLAPTECDVRCNEALSLVGLGGLEDASPFDLSGGQQRLCAIAGVLAMRPRLLVLDEPCAGLDPKGRHELRRILDDLMASGMTLIEVTHSMDDAARADDLIVLDRSHLMFQGTPQEVFCRENREALEGAGLGLPSALTLALRLEDEGGRPLGDPLTLDALKCALGTGPHREVV